MSEKTVFSPGSFFHGTKADLQTGDFIITGKKKTIMMNGYPNMFTLQGL